MKGLGESDLSRFRQFYNCYASILGTLSQESIVKELNVSILGTASQESNSMPIRVSANASVKKQQKNTTHFKQLFNQTSFSHFVELIKIEDEIKRNYYELLILHTQPTVREL